MVNECQLWPLQCIKSKCTDNRHEWITVTYAAEFLWLWNSLYIYYEHIVLKSGNKGRLPSKFESWNSSHWIEVSQMDRHNPLFVSQHLNSSGTISRWRCRTGNHVSAKGTQIPERAIIGTCISQANRGPKQVDISIYHDNNPAQTVRGLTWNKRYRGKDLREAYQGQSSCVVERHEDS